jgi:hypothetical protein
MSIEISILSDIRLSSITEWQRLIELEGFPLRLCDDGRLAEDGGSLTAQLRAKPISIEYRNEDFYPLKNLYKDVNFGSDWKYVLAIPWISGFDVLTAAWMAATAYARATGGVVFDPQEGKVFDPSEAFKIVQEIDRKRPEAEATLRGFIQRLSAKSPEAEAALRTFLQRYSPKAD